MLSNVQRGRKVPTVISLFTEERKRGEKERRGEKEKRGEKERRGERRNGEREMRW